MFFYLRIFVKGYNGEKDFSFSFFMLIDLEIRIVNNGRKLDEWCMFNVMDLEINWKSILLCVLIYI